MPSWKKVIVSGSQAHLQGITASNLTNNTSTPTGQIVGYNPTTGIFSYFNTSSIVSALNAFVQGGNSFGATAVLGTNDNNNLQFETNGSARITIISSSGNVGIGTAAPTAQLETTEDIIVNGVNIGNGGGDQTTNTRVGLAALAANNSNVTAQRNTAVGYLALNSNTNGADNTSLGHSALQLNVIGILNTALGSNALLISTASENTAVGADTLVANQGGGANTAVGAGALYENVNGSGNTAVGAYAGKYLSDGSSTNTNSNTSTFLGNSTKASGSNGTNEIVIGYDTIGAGNNSVVLGNTNITKTLLRAGVGIGLSNIQTPSNTLQVSGSLWTTTITASNIPSASNAHVLLYNSASGNITYLSTSSIGNISGTGTADRVVLWNTSNSINDDAELTFNRTSNVLTIGTSTFGNHITASGNISASGNLSVTGNSTITGTETVTGRLTANGAITTTIITASGNISSSGNLSITGTSTLTGATTVGGTLGVTGVTTLSDQLNVNSSNGIVTNQTSTFPLLNTNVATINFGGAATNINMGASNGTVTIAGDLTVNGTTTVINTDTLSIEDKYIVLGRAVGGTAPASEGGIIVEGAGGSGSAFLFNSGSGAANGLANRWGVALNVPTGSSNATPTDFMVTVSGSGANPTDGFAPTYGSASFGFGNMHVNTTSGEIWIYS